MTNLVVGILILLAIYLFVARRGPVAGKRDRASKNGVAANNRKSRKVIAASSRWRATSIVHDEKACDAVKAIGGRRFLDTEKSVPALPLPECDVARCNCKYARHEDRRDSSYDRRSPNALQAELYDRSGEENRRERRRGRRKTDWQ